MTNSEKIKNEIIKIYRERTQKSKALHEKVKTVVPGGDTRAVAHFDPYPFFVSEGKGCFLTDVDENVYIDCVNNMSALVHGHAHPPTVQAIQTQAEKGTCHSAPIDMQYKLATHLCDRIESVEKVRFCNCGTEATLFCLRASRAFTGRVLIVKIDGGYHGAHDAVQANLFPDIEASDLPRTQLTQGVPSCTADGVLVAPLNDLPAMERIFSQHKDQIAAVILEPMLGSSGAVARNDYLKDLRELTQKNDALLIFDEVVTLRLHEGGYQAVTGIKPDLTAMGKCIGGGVPVGAYGGRSDVMAVFDHTKPGHVVHSGTFSGNALTMTAGLACLTNFRQPEIDRINALGDRLRQGLTKVFEETGVAGSVGGYGSIVFIYAFDEFFNNGRDYANLMVPKADFTNILNLALLNQGLFSLAKGSLILLISTPMDEKIIDDIITKFESALNTVASLANSKNK